MPIHYKTPDLEDLKPRIAVIGVGGAGGNAINNMIDSKLEGVRFIAANTDAQALLASQAETKIQLGASTTEGLGAGSKPEIGAAAAEESIEEIKSHLNGLHMVFITAGMGGGTGTGAAPVIAKAAREEGVLTVGVVTKPFHFEGQRRMRAAEFGIQLLAEQVDTLIVIPNQNLFRVAVVKTTFSEAFAMADQVLYDGISCITDVMVKEGIINLDFADVNLIMRNMGKAMMGTGLASGENRGREAAEAAISNPLLDDVTLRGARGLLVSIIGGRDDLTLYEVDEAANRVREEIATDANIIVGTAFDESLAGSVRVSVVATGLEDNVEKKLPHGYGHQMNRPRQQSKTEDPSLNGRPDKVAPEAGGSARTRQADGKAEKQTQQSKRRRQNTARNEYKMPSLAMEEEALGELRQPGPGVDEQTSDNSESGVRMPSYDDFPPVAQNLLRTQMEPQPNGARQARPRGGILERLASIAKVKEALLSRREEPQSVAQWQHYGKQSPRIEPRMGSEMIDPHAKGGALSSRGMSDFFGADEMEEVTDFPSFLRK